MNVLIRQANRQDIETIKALLSENQLPTADIDRNSVRFFIAPTENRIIGTVGIEQYNSIGLLRSLAVVEEFRNRKVGEKLVDHLTTFCNFRSINELYLLTTTADSYFSKFGFQKIDRNQVPDAIKQTREYSEICSTSAVIMYRRLA